MTKFQSNLRLAMDNAGISQTKLSKLSGISEGAISSYLSGRFAPKQDRVYALALALRCDPGWLMGLDYEGPTDSDVMLSLYQALPDDKKDEAVRYLRFLIQESKQ